MPDFNEQLENAVTIPDIFEVVKDATRKVLKTGRAGLTCGLTEIGTEGGRLIGAMYPVGSNIIVVNKAPILKILRENRQLYRPYAFHVLLHEYLHSLGYLDEGVVKDLTVKITERTMGSDHIAAEMARDPARFLPELTYTHVELEEDAGVPGLEMIKDFDRSSVNYIS